MKKMLVILMVITLFASFAMSAAAARSLTDEEKRLLADLEGREILGQKASAADIISLENYLMGTDEPLTAEEVNTIVADMDEVAAIIKETGVTNINELPKEVKDKVIKIARSAGSVAGLSVSITSAGKSSSIIITDKKTGTSVVRREEVIKKTSSPVDFNMISLLTVVIALGSSAVFLAVRKPGRKTVAARSK